MSTIYELPEFRAKLRSEKELYTFDELAESYGVNKYYLWHIIKDDDYVPSPAVSATLGIIVLRPAPSCPVCGIVHLIEGECTRGFDQTLVLTPTVAPKPMKIVKRKPNSKKASRPRATINITNPESAAQTIKKKMNPDMLALLVQLLKE